jgi:hypothetical protein
MTTRFLVATLILFFCSFAKSDDRPLTEQFGLLVCSTIFDSKIGRMNSQEFLERSRQCESLLSAPMKEVLRKARTCNRRVNEVYTAVKSPDELERFIFQTRSCAQEFNQILDTWKIPGDGSERSLWEFTTEITDYFENLSDQMLIIARFNEAVKRNDVRIVTSIIGTLYSEDAKKLIPSGLTTAMLIERRNALITTHNQRMEEILAAFKKTRSKLLSKEWIIF